MTLLTLNEIEEFDKSNIIAIYETWPEHFMKASNITVKTLRDPESYNAICLCGVGGSATSCDMLNDLLAAYSKKPSSVSRGVIPATIGKDSLIIVNSVSGNTKETLSMATEASKRGAEVISISSGGKLKEFSNKNGYTHVDIPNLSLPRASLPYLIMPGLKLIEPFLKNQIDVERLIEDLKLTAMSISAKSPYEENIAKKIASFLRSGFALCFTSPYLLSVGTRFKNSLNENAKVHCVRESVLEASHNEIVPFTFNNDSQPRAVLLNWIGDDSLANERFKRVSFFFDKIRQPYIEYSVMQDDLLSAMMCSTFVLDYASLYVAVARKIDPSPTPAIDILKSLD